MYSPIYISDCIRYTIESSLYCSVPAKIINIGGLETTSQFEIIKIIHNHKTNELSDKILSLKNKNYLLLL